MAGAFRDGLDGVTEYDPQVLVDLDLVPFSYTGNAMFSQGFFDQSAASGHPVALMIQETYSTRSQEGYKAGVVDCQFAESRARQRGWSGPIAYVASDGNGADRWSSREYARGIGDTSSAGFYILGYGANGVLEDFDVGVLDSSGAARLFIGTDGRGARWVPETWPGGNNAIGQVVGPSPVPATDLNRVYVDLAGGSPIPSSVAQEDEMFVVFHVPPGAAPGSVVQAVAVSGHVQKVFLGGPVVFGFLTVPADAKAFLDGNPGMRWFLYNDNEWDRLAAATTNVLAPPGVADTAEVVAGVLAGIGQANGSSGPTDAQKQAVDGVVSALHAAGDSLAAAFA
jgi:hypothetical protein